MKKILIILITLMMMPVVAEAQEAWKPKTPRKTMNFRFGIVQLERDGYYYTIWLKTNHPWDEHMVIHLGNGRDEALKSIEQLIEISNADGNIRYFDKAEIYVGLAQMTIKRIEGEVFFGEAIIGDGELKRMKKFIEQGK